MWARAVEMLGEAERLHRRFFQLADAGRAAATWEPPADVFDDGREIVIVVAMPGVHADRVEVRRRRRHAGRARHAAAAAHATGHRIVQLEIPYGTFERRIALPPGVFELAAPELAEGCLWLRLTRHTEAR
jgi:HSP20 family molecular chaperone IbpA